MPILEVYTGELIIALATILWGIFIETWFVSRWTILFNVVPLVALLMTVDLGDLLLPVELYTLFAMLLIVITGHHGIKQAFGAKSYGTLTLILAMYSLGGIGSDWAIAGLIGFSIIVYSCWAAVRSYKKHVMKEKKKAEDLRKWQQQQYELAMRQKRQAYFQQYFHWPDW